MTMRRKPVRYQRHISHSGKEKLLADTKQSMSLDDLYNRIQEGNVKDLNLIIKADVQGSVEAVKQSLLKLSNEEVALNVSTPVLVQSMRVM